MFHSAHRIDHITWAPEVLLAADGKLLSARFVGFLDEPSLSLWVAVLLKRKREMADFIV